MAMAWLKIALIVNKLEWTWVELGLIVASGMADPVPRALPHRADACHLNDSDPEVQGVHLNALVCAEVKLDPVYPSCKMTSDC